MTLPPIRVTETKAVPMPFTSLEVIVHVQTYASTMMLHAMARPGIVSDYLRGLMTVCAEPQWRPVGTYGSRHLLLKRGAGEYMAINYTSAAHSSFSFGPDGICVQLRWEGETPSSDGLLVDALRVELATVSGVLDKWLESEAMPMPV